MSQSPICPAFRSKTERPFLGFGDRVARLTILLWIGVLVVGCISFPTWSYSRSFPVPRPGQDAHIVYQTAAMAKAEYPRYFIRLFLVTNAQTWVQPDFVEDGKLVRTIGGPPGRKYTIQIDVSRRMASTLPALNVLILHVDGRSFRLVDPEPIYTIDRSGKRDQGTAEFVVDDAILDALTTAKTITYQTATYRHQEPTYGVISMNYAVPILRTLPDEMPPDWRADL